MSNPISPPSGTRTYLGTDGSNSFYLIGGEVYRTDGRYWWSYCAASRWAAQSVARRIARRAAEAEKQRQRERAIIEAERRRMEHGRRGR